MNPRSPTFSPLIALFAFVALAFAAGCAQGPVKPQTETTRAIFYPQSPDPPRIQHLKKFANVRDLVATGSGFADFVIGEEGKATALLRPYGAALFEGRLYVSDSRVPGLVVFDIAAGKLSVIEGTGAARMRRPVNVTIDVDGAKYVTDMFLNQVLVFDRNDRFVRAFGKTDQFRPVDAAILGERLYVSDLLGNRIHVLDKRTGATLFQFGKKGTEEEGSLHQPTNIALSPEGDLYVVETGNFRVSRFTKEGKFVSRFGEAGQSPGTFARPKGIAVDRAGRVYVGDSAFQNVQVFDPYGRILMHFGQPVGDAPGLNLPAGIAIDYDNVGLFRRYAAPGFEVEYVILVVSQFVPDQVDVFGFGRMQGARYPADEPPPSKPGG